MACKRRSDIRKIATSSCRQAHFNLTDHAVDAQMAHIKSSGARALINYNTGTPFGTDLHAYTDVGLDIPLVTQPAALNYAVMEQYAAFPVSRPAGAPLAAASLR